MANTIKVTNKVAKGVTAATVYYSVLANKLSSKYNSEFKNVVEKIGESVNIRKSVLGTTRRNSFTFAAQDVYQPYVTLTVDQIFGYDLAFTQKDWDLYIVQNNDVNGFLKAFVITQASVISNQLDAWLHAKIMAEAYNTVGQYGLPLSKQTITAAKTILQKVGCPEDKIFGVLTPDANQDLVNTMVDMYNPSADITDIYRKGFVTNFVGIPLFATNVAPERADGTAMVGVVPTVASVSAASVATSGIYAETSTISLAGLVQGGTLTVGEVFTLSGANGAVKALNMNTKDRTNMSQQFTVVTAVDSTTSAAQSVVIRPAIITSGAYANVYVPAGSLSVIKHSDASATRGSESLILHSDAVELAFPDLTVPDMVEESNSNIGAMASDPKSAVKMRFIRFFDGFTSTWNSRIDCYAGAKVVNDQNIVRIRR